MPHLRKDRVKETTTTTGTGALALAGAVSGFQSFAAAIGVGNTCDYAIVGPGGVWETGVGALSAAGTLQRTSVYESSHAGALVNLPAGTKEVFVSLPGLALSALVDAIAAKLDKTGGTLTGALSFTPGALQILTGGTTAVAFAAGNNRRFELRSGANTLNVTGLPESGADLELDLLFTAGTLAFAQTVRWKIGGGTESTAFADTGVTLTAGTWYMVVLRNMGGTLYGVVG